MTTNLTFIPAPTLDATAVARQIIATIAADISAHATQVNAAVELLDGGATVPFIARYRKEATGGLDDTQLRTLEERLAYLRELAQRRVAVLASIAEQGKLTQLLANNILAAASKQEVEDLYLPYKPKRRTKAQIAREHGLQSLADMLLAEQPQDVLALTDHGVPITAMVAHGNVAGTQFHPEKSQKLGLKLIANFLSWKP